MIDRRARRLVGQHDERAVEREHSVIEAGDPAIEQLVRLVVEELLLRVEIPGPEAGSWDVRLKTLEANVRRELGGIPGIRAGISPALVPASSTNTGAQKCVIQRVRKTAAVILGLVIGSCSVPIIVKSRTWSMAMITMTSPRTMSIALNR